LETTTYNFTLNDFKKEYLEQLGVFQRANLEERQKTVEKMVNAIKTSNYPSDWLRHNPSLKAACKKFGITKSGELREFVKASYEKQQQTL
jgi:hypothetical protein